jgi:hypothetical protein
MLIERRLFNKLLLPLENWHLLIIPKKTYLPKQQQITNFAKYVKLLRSLVQVRTILKRTFLDELR